MANAFDSANFPEREPDQLVIGDRWMWKRTDLATDYPIATYGLTYTARLDGAGSTTFAITASESGTVYTVEVASATTAAYTAGTYRWQAYITRTSDSQRIEVDSGSFLVIPNRAVSTADPRSHVKKVLDAIEATIEGRASVDQMGYSIAGRSLSRTPIADLLVLRDRYRIDYRSEQNSERIANGLPSKNRLLTRF